ncbi:MAG: hypothetical protein QE265_12560 [Rhodoferax sp.]|nr:hypothetical protein [Rhodoferax sp.]
MSAEIKSAALDVADNIWSFARTVSSAAVHSVQWTSGALAGEFNTKATVGQIMVDAAISMFPIAGEVTAARDATAISLRMSGSEQEANNTWNWVSLVLCLLAVVPVLGGVLKGVGRLLMRAASKSEDVVKLGTEILAFLRKMGYGDAHKWLMALDFAKYQQPVKQAFNTLVQRLVQASAFVVKNLGGVLPPSVRNALQALQAKLQHLQMLAERKIPQAFVELNARLNQVRAELVSGQWAKVHVGGGAVKVQTTEARIARKSDIVIESKGHTSAHSYTHKEGWPSLIGYKKTENLPDGSTLDFFPNLESFSIKAPIRPELLAPGQSVPLVRVLDTSRGGKDKAGGFWTVALPPNGKTWRLDCAIKSAWNSNGQYVRLDRIPTVAEMRAKNISVPDDWDGVRAWSGRIAEQVDMEKLHNGSAVGTGVLLPGGDVQLYIDFYDPHHRPLKEWIERTLVAQPTNWKDATIPQALTDQVEYLHAWEFATKTTRDGYTRRISATAAKQTNNQTNHPHER